MYTMYTGCPPSRPGVCGPEVWEWTLCSQHWSERDLPRSGGASRGDWSGLPVCHVKSINTGVLCMYYVHVAETLQYLSMIKTIVFGFADIVLCSQSRFGGLEMTEELQCPCSPLSWALNQAMSIQPVWVAVRTHCTWFHSQGRGSSCDSSGILQGSSLAWELSSHSSLPPCFPP